MSYKDSKIFLFFFPKNSFRRIITKILLHAIKHPIIFLQKINRKRIKKVLNSLINKDYEILNQKTTQVLGGINVSNEALVIKSIGSKDHDVEFEKIAFPSFEETPLVSIIIPVYNQFNYTHACLKSIFQSVKRVPYEIIIADDCSTDNTVNIGSYISGINVIKTQRNMRFLGNCNNAAQYAKGKYLLFLNNDTQVQSDWLESLVDLIESDSSIGMVGSKLVYPNGKLQEAGGIVWRDGSAWNYGNGDDPSKPEYNYVKEVDYISGASIMIRTEIWEKIGGFDELYSPAYCEDSDLAFGVRKLGYKTVYQPKSIVVHFEGISNGTDTNTGVKSYQIINARKFRQKWCTELLKKQTNGHDLFIARDRSFGKKTILFIDHYVPTYDQDCGSRCVFEYLKLFVQLGFNVKFIGDNYYQSEPYTTVLQQKGIEVLYGSWYANNWKTWIDQSAPYLDYVFLNRPHISIKYIDYIKQHTMAKIIYYGHDLHFLRTIREYDLSKNKALLSESENWKELELSLMRMADMSYYPSEVEVEKIKELDSSIKVKAIPVYMFQQKSITAYDYEHRSGVFFIGGFNHTPNVDAVKWLCNSIVPRIIKEIPEISFIIAGSNMPNEIKNMENDNVLMKGFVSEEELIEYYNHCRMCIVPLRYGAGIKGKVIESLRYGLPLVTTPCGAEGIKGIEEVACIAVNENEIANCIINLYNDKEKLTSMHNASMDFINRNFSVAGAINAIHDEFDIE